MVADVVPIRGVLVLASSLQAYSGMAVGVINSEVPCGLDAC